MKARLISRVAVLVALGIASSLLTSTLVAQRKQGQTYSASMKPVPGAATKFRKDQGPAPAPVGISVPVKFDAHFTFNKMTVEPAPGQVAVDAQVTLQDSRGPTPFMWAVVVMDEGGKKRLSEMNYVNQIFSIQSKEPIKPTFKDVVQLQPGTYKIQVRLYEFSRDVGVMFPDGEFDLSALTPQGCISHSEIVTIPG